MADAEIFDRSLRMLRRDRAARAGRPDFVRGHIAGELLERLDLVTRRFTRALDLGASDDAVAAPLRARGIDVVATDPGTLNAARAGGACCDADRLPFPPASFDLVVAAGGLDMVNDLPGALALIRRTLRPDGLFLGGFVGAGSLATLRGAMLAADLAGPEGHAAPRIHPQVDIRAMGDLLQRAGFALPVADGESLDVRYAGLAPLVADIRAAGAANLMLRRDRRPLTRHQYAAAHAAFAATADADGRVTERLDLVYCLGWAPADGQPRPARRGSGVRSLADALKPVPPAAPTNAVGAVFRNDPLEAYGTVSMTGSGSTGEIVIPDLIRDLLPQVSARNATSRQWMLDRVQHDGAL